MAGEYEPTLIARTTTTTAYVRPRPRPRPGRSRQLAHVHAHVHTHAFYGPQLDPRSQPSPAECHFVDTLHEPPTLGIGLSSHRRDAQHISRSFECTYEQRLLGVAAAEYQPAHANQRPDCARQHAHSHSNYSRPPLAMHAVATATVRRVQMEQTRACSLDEQASAYSPTAEAYHSLVQAQAQAQQGAEMLDAYTTVGYDYNRFPVPIAGCECSFQPAIQQANGNSNYRAPRNAPPMLQRNPEIAIALDSTCDADSTNPTNTNFATSIRRASSSETDPSHDENALAVQTVQNISRSFDSTASNRKARRTSRTSDPRPVSPQQSHPTPSVAPTTSVASRSRSSRLTIPASNHPTLVQQRSADQSCLQPPDDAAHSQRLVRSFETQPPAGSPAHPRAHSQTDKEARLRSLTARRDKLTHAKSVIEAQAQRRNETPSPGPPADSKPQTQTPATGRKPDENRRAAMRRAQTAGMQRRESWLRCMNAGKIDAADTDSDTKSKVDVPVALQEGTDAESSSRDQADAEVEREAQETTSDDRQNSGSLNASGDSRVSAAALPQATMRALADRFGVSHQQISMLVVAIRDTLALEQRHAQTLSELRQRDAHAQTASLAAEECARRDALVGDDDTAECRSSVTQTELDARDDELDSLKEYYELELEKQRSQHEMQLFRLKDEQIMRALQMKDEIDRLQRESEKYKILAGIETLTRDAQRSQKRSEPLFESGRRSSRPRLTSTGSSSKDAGTDTRDFDEVVRQLLNIDTQKRQQPHRHRVVYGTSRYARPRRLARVRARAARTGHTRWCRSTETDSSGSCQSADDENHSDAAPASRLLTLPPAQPFVASASAEASVPPARVVRRPVAKMSTACLMPLYWRKIDVSKHHDVTNLENDGKHVIWQQMEDVMSLPFGDLETLFSSAADTTVTVTVSSNQSTGPERHRKPKTANTTYNVKLLDAKRSSKINGFLSMSRISATDVRHALMKSDASGPCGVETMRTLSELCADYAELEAIASFARSNNCAAQLDRAETFLFELAQIPCFSERLFCVSYLCKFGEQLNDVQFALESLAAACQSLANSPAVERLFGIILTVGNFLNGANCQRGDADAFHLEILAKLKHVKARDGSTTLLKFVLMQYIKLYASADQRNVLDEFPFGEPLLLERAARVNFDVLLKVLRDTRQDLETCASKVQIAVTCDDPANQLEPFRSVMQRFLSDAHLQLAEQETHLADVCSLFYRTVAYFCLATTKENLRFTRPQLHPADADADSEAKVASLSPREMTPKEFFAYWIPFMLELRQIWRLEHLAIARTKDEEAQQSLEDLRGDYDFVPEATNSL